MNFFTKRTLIACAFFTSISSLAQITANTKTDALPAHLEAEVQAEVQNILESRLKVSTHQLDTLDAALEELIIAVSNGNLKPSNKQETLTQLTALRTDMHALRENSFIDIDIRSLHMIALLIEHTCSSLTTGLESGLDQVPALNPENITKRAAQAIDLDILDELLQNNEANLQALDQQSRSAGLAWYNKAYRSFNSYVLEPSVKYHVKSRTQSLVAAGVCGLLFWRYLTPYPEDKKDYNWLHNLLGPKPNFNGQFGITNSTNLKMFGRAEYATALSIPFLTFFSKQVYEGYQREKFRIESFTHKHAKNLHNKLMGGAYANKTVQDATIIEPKATFADLVGAEHIKKEFGRLIRYLEDPERYNRAEVIPERGYLLLGDSRTGKSFSAEALAGEIKAMYKRKGLDHTKFKFHNIPHDYIKRNGLPAIMSIVKRQAPCVIFLDEIDLLRLQRTGDSTLLSEFLQLMGSALDNADLDRLVIIVAATNRPENIDFALRQPGRFGKEIFFDLPTYENRLTFLNKEFAKRSLNPASFDLEKIARETTNESYASLMRIINYALIDAKRSGVALNQELLEQNIDHEIRHIVSDEGRNIPESEQKIIASHQAGQALTHMLLAHDRSIAKITIKPYLKHIEEKGQWQAFAPQSEDQKRKILYGRIFYEDDKDSIKIGGYHDLMQRCKHMVAGDVAESIILGASGFTYQADNLKTADQIALNLVLEGLDFNMLTQDLKTEYLRKAIALRKNCEQEVRELLEKHKLTLEKVVAALLEKQSLTGDELKELINEDDEIQQKISTVDAATIERELGIVESTSATA